MAQGGRIAVVGAGIVGVATALTLARAGEDVVLVDKAGPAAGASFGNAGLLAASAVMPVGAPGLPARLPGMLASPEAPLFLDWARLPRLAPALLPWGMRFLRHCSAPEAARLSAALAPLVTGTLAEHEALAAGTPAARFIRPCDYLYLYPNRAAFLADAHLWGLRAAAGITWEELEGPTLREAEPAFAPDLGFAARMGGHGRITDPGGYVAALARAFEAAGGQIITAEVHDVLRAGGAVAGLRLGGQTLPCTAVVLTAGAWSGGLARRLGLTVPLMAERGYHLELWGPSRLPRQPVMLARGQFVATPMEGRLRLAGIAEFGTPEAPPARAPLAYLRRQLARVLPGLAWREAREWVGPRPTTPDSLPVIGAVPGLSGAFVGFGHQHVGLTAGPVTARILAQLVRGQRPNLDLAPYAPGRFS